MSTEKKSLSDIFSEKLTLLMEEGKVNQSQLADFVGVQQSAVSKWLRRESMPGSELLFKIAERFEISPSELLGWEKRGKIRPEALAAESLAIAHPGDETDKQQFNNECITLFLQMQDSLNTALGAVETSKRDFAILLIKLKSLNPTATYPDEKKIYRQPLPGHDAHRMNESEKTEAILAEVEGKLGIKPKARAPKRPKVALPGGT